MGVVHDGWDPLIARRVAIKSVPLPASPDAETAEEIARFRREAQAAGRLTHPNIVGVYDYGETSDIAYIVMEFVDGPTLKSLLDKKERFPLDSIGRIMGDVLTGLQFSHERGVVHRDIKPANVMLTSAGQAKLADFGIARIEMSSMTQAGTMLGTPAYMSPEQFRGEAADARTDVYSAGVMLYQLLTGERPFEGGLTAIMHKVLNVEPPAPSQLAGTVPPAVDAVVQKAMAKRPADRFASAAAFNEALRAAIAAPATVAAAVVGGVEDEATMVRPSRQSAAAAPAAAPKKSAAPPPPPPPAPAPAGSKMPLIAGVAAVVVVAAAGAGWFLTRAPAPTQTAETTTPPTTTTPTTTPPPAPTPPAETKPAETRPAQPPAAQVQPPATPPVQPTAPTQVQPAEPKVAPATPPSSPTTTATAPTTPTPTTPVTPTTTAPPAPTVSTKPTEPPPPAPTVTAPQSPPPTAPTPAAPTPAPLTNGQQEKLAVLPPEAMLQQIGQALRGASCAVAEATLGDGGRFAVHGFADAATTVALQNQVGSLAGTQPVAWHLHTVDPVFCPALALLRPISPLDGGPSPGVGVALAANRTVLKDGEAILPRLTMPDFAGELRVDYFAHDGTLAHLYPTLADPASQLTAQPSRKLKPGEHLALGDPGPGKPQWQSGTPYGTDMIFAIASSVPLKVATTANGEEKADGYLANLGRAVEQARAAGARVSGGLLLVDAVPKAK